MMARLDEIAQRAEKATKGPWTVSIDYNYGDETGFARVFAPDVDGKPDMIVDYVSREDCEFIAHAREDIPYLVAEVRSLQAENEAAHRVLSQAGVTRGGGPDGADPIIFDLPSRLHGLLEEQLEVRAEVRSLQQQLSQRSAPCAIEGCQYSSQEREVIELQRQLAEAQQQIAALRQETASND